MRDVTVAVFAALMPAVAYAQDVPCTPYPSCLEEIQEEPRNPVPITIESADPTPSGPALCETELGFGMVSYTSDNAMFDEINKRLQAGETVVSTNGYTIIGTAVRSDGRLVVCFRQ